MPFYLLADQAFPRTGSLASKLMVVPKDNSRDFDPSNKKLYAAITHVRQAVEWGMRAIKSSFQRLRCALLLIKKIEQYF